MSTIKATTLSNLAGSKTVPTDTVVDGSAKAWVNFNGTGTVAIRRAFNVSSITDNGVGDYTVNFTTAMSDANYSSTVTSDRGSPAMFGYSKDVSTPRTSSLLRVGASISTTGADTDSSYMNVAIFS